MVQIPTVAAAVLFAALISSCLQTSNANEPFSGAMANGDHPPDPPIVYEDEAPACSEPCSMCGDKSKKAGGEKDEVKCDCKKRKELLGKAAGAYKGLFYNNDFSYLDDPCRPCFGDKHLGEALKQLRPNCCTTLDLGGQYRARFMDERNMRGLGLTGRSDSFLLHRTRLYGNLKVGDNFRFYVEYLDAVSNYEDLRPRPIEENRSDLLNAFGDVMLLDNDCGKLVVRAGRQELLYGDQRTVSPLDWANTRRTFDGFKLFWRADDWDADIFWMRPVFPDAKNFDNPDNSQEFTGMYATYKKLEHGVLDLYFLRYAESQGNPDFEFNTYGVRHKGDYEGFLWDFEGAYQWGEFGANNVSAGFFTTGLGYQWKCLPGKPTLWTYYDWASGSDVPFTGYHHLFPLAHKYTGFMDLFGRRNIEDLNFLFTVQPTDKVKLLAWFHLLNLQRGDDIPYSVVMGPSPAPGFAVVPGGSQDLGQELDLLLSWQITPRMNCVLGYSHFLSGDWFDTNPTPGLSQTDADFFYAQYQVNF